MTKPIELTEKSDELRRKVHKLFGDHQTYDGGYQSCYDGKWLDMTNEVCAVADFIKADRKRVALEAHNKAVNRCREEICYHFDPNGEREPDVEAEAIDALLEHLLKAQQEEA